MDKAIRTSIIEQAYDEVIEPLSNWTRPELVEAIGPNDLAAVGEFEAAVQKVKQTVKRDIEDLSSDDLATINALIEDRYRLVNCPPLATICKAIFDLAKRTPPPIASGFGAASLRADFSYWRTMPYLTMHEAVMLSVGLDPSSYSEQHLSDLAKKKRSAPLWSALEFLIARRQVFGRFYPFGPSGYMTMPFPALKRALETYSVELDHEFEAALAARSPRPETVQHPDAPTSNLNSQERETLLKLVAAMSCEQYGFDPKQQRSEALKNIQEDVERAGLSMDAKTVRKWVRQAVELIPKSYWE